MSAFIQGQKGGGGQFVSGTFTLDANALTWQKTVTELGFVPDFFCLRRRQSTYITKVGPSSILYDTTGFFFVKWEQFDPGRNGLVVEDSGAALGTGVTYSGGMGDGNKVTLHCDDVNGILITLGEYTPLLAQTNYITTQNITYYWYAAKAA